MGLISIGSLTFTRNPANMTPLEDIRYNSHVLTYSAVAHFSWGVDIVGKEIDMTWPHMNNPEFNALKAIYEADATVVLDPDDGSGKTYNVELISLNSTHYQGRDNSGDRLNVNLKILIISEV